MYDARGDAVTTVAEQYSRCFAYCFQEWIGICDGPMKMFFLDNGSLGNDHFAIVLCEAHGEIAETANP